MFEKRWAYVSVSFMLLEMAALGSAQEVRPAASSEYRLTFDNTAPGALPEGWKIEATNPSGRLAEWKVMADAQAPSKPNILSLTKSHDDSSDVFNLCWTNTVQFRDGAIEVSLRADTGKEDQGRTDLAGQGRLQLLHRSIQSAGE